MQKEQIRETLKEDLFVPVARTVSVLIRRPRDHRVIELKIHIEETWILLRWFGLTG